MANMDSEHDIFDVFIFCWYPDGWVPRAIIADISKFDDEANMQMQNILSVNDGVIEKVLIENKDGEGNPMSYKLRGINKEIIIDDENTLMALSTWEQLSNNINTIANMYRNDMSHWIHFTKEYYINDTNANLSPINVHKFLSSLKYHPNNPDFKFNVKYCVLVSDISVSFYNNDNVRPLRFFYKTKTFTRQDKISNILKSFFDVKRIVIADEKYHGNGNYPYVGYGYLTPKDKKQWSKLNEKKFNLGNTIVLFD